MLTCKVGESIVDTFSFKDEKLREWSNKDILKCPVCGARMIYCHGDYKIPYFKHESGSDCLDIYSEGMTEEHINGIKNLYEWLKIQENIINIQLEKWIPETRQRPDIYFEREVNGCIRKYAIEFQCSPISTKYNERHDLYRLNNIEDIWILGVEKYGIGKFVSLIGVRATDMMIYGMKLKTLEMEIFESKGSLIYLNKGMIYKAKEKLIIPDRKTMFDIIYDIDDGTNNDFDQLFSNKDLIIKNPKFNNITSQLENICNDLNEKWSLVNEGDKYNYHALIHKDEIVFEAKKGYYHSIIEMSYNEISHDIIDKDFQKEIDRVEIYINQIKSFNDNIDNELENLSNITLKKIWTSYEQYRGKHQIKISIDDIYRVFEIDFEQLTMVCNVWIGSKRVGWTLTSLCEYELQVIDVHYILAIIKSYYIDELLKEKIHQNHIFLDTEDVIKYRKKQIELRECIDCENRFKIEYGEIEFYKKKGLHTPKRCPKCREIKKTNNSVRKLNSFN